MTTIRDRTRYFDFTDHKSKYPTQARIESFRMLPDGWDYGIGGPIQNNVVQMARQLNMKAVQLGLTVTEAFPSSSGEIILSVYRKPHVFDFTIGIESKCTLEHILDDETVDYKENLTLHDAEEILLKFQRDQWITSDSSILLSTATKRADSRVFRFGIPAAEHLESQLSARSAYI